MPPSSPSQSQTGWVSREKVDAKERIESCQQCALFPCPLVHALRA
jgi:hypothetical protein